MPSPSTARTSTRVTLRSDARELRVLRQQLKQFFAEHELAAPLTDDLILVANELATNAIEASELGSDVVVDARIDGMSITLAIENVGEPFVLPAHVVLPEKTRTRGRGLALASHIVDDLCAEQLTGGTRIIATCHRT